MADCVLSKIRKCFLVTAMIDKMEAKDEVRSHPS